jgi:hypothetical protein
MSRNPTADYTFHLKASMSTSRGASASGDATSGNTSTAATTPDDEIVAAFEVQRQGPDISSVRLLFTTDQKSMDSALYRVIKSVESTPPRTVEICGLTSSGKQQIKAHWDADQATRDWYKDRDKK